MDSYNIWCSYKISFEILKNYKAARFQKLKKIVLFPEAKINF